MLHLFALTSCARNLEILKGGGVRDCSRRKVVDGPVVAVWARGADGLRVDEAVFKGSPAGVVDAVYFYGA